MTTTTTCRICGQPTTYGGRHASVALRAGREAHIYCAQLRRGFDPERVEAHALRRAAAAGEIAAAKTG